MSRESNSGLLLFDPLSGQIGFAPEHAKLRFPGHTPATAGEVRRVLQLHLVRLEYTLKRSTRRSIGFVVSEHGLSVSAPRSVGVSQIEAALRSKERWIVSKIAAIDERRRRIPQVRWQDGGSVPFFGHPLCFLLAADSAADATHSALDSIPQRSSHGKMLRFDSETRTLHLGLARPASSEEVKERVKAWLQAEVRGVFARRLEHFAPRLCVRYRSFRLSSAATRWGSCHADGRISLNWRLVHLPLSSVDYVVAHELAHLKEMNHGPRFWQAVAEVLPGFEIERAYLKNPPAELLPKF